MREKQIQEGWYHWVEQNPSRIRHPQLQKGYKEILFVKSDFK